MTLRRARADHAPTGAVLLTARTMQKVRQHFETETTHRPSKAMYAALADIAATLAEMAEGGAEQKIYLSSLDPGIGKTTVLSHFVDALLEDNSLEHVGVLVCVARLDEIKTLVHRMGLPAGWFACYTSDAQVNALGGDTEPNKARVLFTTQQMVERRLDGQSFAACEVFHYRGKPRQVRIWDESWLPGEGITVSRYALSDLLSLLVSGGYRRLADKLEDLFFRVRSIEDGTRLEFPDLAQHAELNAVLSLVDSPRDNAEAKYQEQRREQLSLLWYLSGRTVVVRRDGKDGNAVLSYRDTLPEDLAPLLVLDASGRVRETYAEMEKHRDNIARLASAAKRYDRLTVNVWNTGGGKSSFERGSAGAKELVEAIAATINTKPGEEWLVIHHAASKRTEDIPAGVSPLLPDASKVHFVNWGRHAATNAFAHVKNVILAGTLFYRPSQYEALGRLAAGMKPEQGEYPLSARKRIELGESKHGILQAACRGAVRNCDGEQAHAADAYLIASVRSGIPQTLPELFPGCRVVRWAPVKRALTGKVKEAVEYLQRRFSAPGTAVVKFSEVQKVLGMSAANFRRAVRQHPAFVAEIAELSLVEWGPKALFTAFKRVDASDFGFTPSSAQ
ncbi:MAG: hypothetical protein EPN55_05805 [Gammaproteobacteria bacterium]|nr:MAG: hypothetical protein EPN55_05805 [Gammaproteobacteria bacterium]